MITLIIKRSRVHGIGLFAPVRIRNGNRANVPRTGHRGFNGSHHPNVTTDNSDYCSVVAIRDIEAGEECFIEYNRDINPGAA
jgi:SET domain-containing protein